MAINNLVEHVTAKLVKLKVTQLIVAISILLMLFSACEKKRERINVYHANGKLKRSIEYRDSKRDGLDLEFDSLGNLIARQQSAGDTLVSFIYYYPTGQVLRKGGFIGPNLFRNIQYFRNGEIKLIHVFEDQLTKFIELYHEDGRRDTIPTTYFTKVDDLKDKRWQKNKRDGVINMHCIITNISGDISDVYATDLIVGRKLAKTGVIADTLKVVKPDKNLNYFFDYPDIPNDTIWCQVMFGSAIDTTADLTVRTLAIWDESKNLNY